MTQLVSLLQGLTLTLNRALEYKILYFIHSPEGHNYTTYEGLMAVLLRIQVFLGHDVSR